ncbi:hypothetical protein PIB30_053841 [Stylosanthes scabra]|uniref:Uncharacterized protein n=1 Tax=Stylosanthes scabra TaxID=79078 RepID=A0ABU6VIC5_9FABA|nr:hypothetical protein [Stylosanthes scabra]
MQKYICFRQFGDSVKHWITLNELVLYNTLGYGSGGSPPTRCSKWMSSICATGDSSIETYIVTHHLILAHAAAVEVYREKFKGGGVNPYPNVLGIHNSGGPRSQQNSSKFHVIRKNSPVVHFAPN